MRLRAIVPVFPLLLATGGWWALPAAALEEVRAHAGLGIFDLDHIALPLGRGIAPDVADGPTSASVEGNVGTGNVAALAVAGPIDPAEESVPAPIEDAPLLFDDAGNELELVRWSVERPMRVDQVALNWGMWPDDLRELNPELADAKVVPAGTELVVHRHDPSAPTQSIGAPNRGRLRSGIPLPEGDKWRLREHRPRGYGARNTIEGLLAAFRTYAEVHPDGPAIRIGEISKRSGGRVKPHVSHRSGRDVDIGYVMKPSPLDEEHYWRRATERTLDAEKTWTLIKALIATDKVQRIFISAKLQRIIAREAAKELSPEEVNLLFDAVNPDASVHTVIAHEHGHRDHMHVRFKCERGNVRCRAKSRNSL